METLILIALSMHLERRFDFETTARATTSNLYVQVTSKNHPIVDDGYIIDLYETPLHYNSLFIFTTL